MKAVVGGRVIITDGQETDDAKFAGLAGLVVGREDVQALVLPVIEKVLGGRAGNHQSRACVTLLNKRQNVADQEASNVGIGRGMLRVVEHEGRGSRGVDLPLHVEVGHFVCQLRIKPA